MMESCYLVDQKLLNNLDDLPMIPMTISDRLYSVSSHPSTTFALISNVQAGSGDHIGF